MTDIEDILFAPVVWGNPDDPDRPGNPLAANSVACKRLLAVLDEALTPALEQFLFELNNSRTRQIVVSRIQDVVAQIPDVYDYRVVCDETNNGPKTIANHELCIDLWLRPRHMVEMMYYRIELGDFGE